MEMSGEENHLLSHPTTRQNHVLRQTLCFCLLLVTIAIGVYHFSYGSAASLESDSSITESGDLVEPKESLITTNDRILDRARRAASRLQNSLDWNSSSQEAYDSAVYHARTVERDGKEVYQPLRMPQGFVHEAELEQEAFEEQLVDLARQLEPTYLAEALDWAESGDQRNNPVLRPIVYALEKPILKDLDLEARTRVEHVVDAIAEKHKLDLTQKEQLRAHLTAPLLMRIRERVHSQVSHYVVTLARDVVLKAANTSNPIVQEIVAQLHGHTTHGLAPVIPRLTDSDQKMINELHDLRAIYKSGVVDKKDFNTQRAKLLSDWLKYAVNDAGGNSNEVLRIDLGGEVRGVTDTGIKHPSPINVKRKIAMEKGMASRMLDRSRRLNSDIIYNLIHSKTQWASVMGCGKKFKSPECSKKWSEIKNIVRQSAKEDDQSVNWGRSRATSSGSSQKLAAGKAKNGGKTPASAVKKPASSLWSFI